MLKFSFFDIDYGIIDDSVGIILYGKSENGKTVAVFDPSYEAYFYILPTDIEKAEKQIISLLKKKNFPFKKIEKCKMLFFGQEREFLKLFCIKPQDTAKARDIIKMLEKSRGGTGVVEDEYEYQIGFYRTYLADKGIDCLDWLEIEGEEIKSDTNYFVQMLVKALKIKKIKTKNFVKPLSLKIIAFDIEVVEEKRGERNIVMLSIYSKDFKKVLTYKKSIYPEYVEIVDNEKTLISRFVEIINNYDPDVIVGYNSDLYDFDVLRERAAKLKVSINKLSRDGSGITFSRRAKTSTAKLKGRIHIDIFNFINNILAPMLQTEVLSLDAVSSEILGDEKIKMEYADIVESWKKEKGLDKLASYCLKDSKLTYRLCEVLLPHICQLSVIVGQSIFDTSRMMYSQLVEWFYIKKAKQSGRVVPNQPKFEEIKKRQKETYIGGYVKEPEAGLYEEIAVIDFASLYPSIISTYNISVETINCGCCKENGYKVPRLPYWFCKNKKGFEASIITQLLQEREKLKKEMIKIAPSSFEYHLYETRQKAIKTIANASYGYYAFPASKWYCKECAESITSFGRYWIKEIMKKAQEQGFNPIYGDTDSAFLLINRKNRKELLNFIEKINNTLPGIMKVELEGLYKRGLFIPKEIGKGTAKKRYALIDDFGRLKIRGLEKVRRDWSSIAKKTQENILKLVLANKDIVGAVKFVRETIKQLKKLNITLKDLVVYEQITKPLENYKHMSPHIIAAKKLNKMGMDIKPGSVIGYVICKGEGKISQRAEPVEFVTIKNIDIDYYIKNQLLPVSLKILKVFGINEKDLFKENYSIF